MRSIYLSVTVPDSSGGKDAYSSVEHKITLGFTDWKTCLNLKSSPSYLTEKYEMEFYGSVQLYHELKAFRICSVFVLYGGNILDYFVVCFFKKVVFTQLILPVIM